MERERHALEFCVGGEGASDEGECECECERECEGEGRGECRERAGDGEGTERGSAELMSDAQKSRSQVKGRIQRDAGAGRVW